MKAYSNDLRRRIIDVIQANEESQSEIAEHFAVSLSFVEKLRHRFRTTHSYEVLPHKGGRERLLKNDDVQREEAVAEHPHQRTPATSGTRFQMPLTSNSR